MLLLTISLQLHRVRRGVSVRAYRIFYISRLQKPVSMPATDKDHIVLQECALSHSGTFDPVLTGRQTDSRLQFQVHQANFMKQQNNKLENSLKLVLGRN